MLVDALRSASSAAPSALADLSSPLPPDAVDPHAVRSDGDGGSWAGQLERDPGAQLVAELVEAYPASLGDLDLVAALKAWERVGAWAAAQHADALRALLARADRFGGFDETAAILATEVRCTQRAAKDKLAWANTLGSFPAVNEALERGEIDVFRARAICDEAMLAPESSAQLVADLGLTLAPSKTPPQIRRALRAAVIGLDPAAAKERAAKVSADRRVEFHPMPDAMAMITAYLPAVDALAVKTALDALARTTAREDPRSFDQRRADYLGAIFHAICDAGEAPLHRDHVPGSAPAAPHDPASPRAAVDDVSDGPGDVYERHNDVSGGPDDVSDGPADTTNGASVASVASDCSDEPAREVVGHAPRTARATLGSGSGSGSALWRRLSTQQRQRPHLQITVSAATLLGLDENPADLTGYGPVPADVARLLATDATWRALYTDRSGAVSAVGERTYRPGAVLARQVAARDRSCTFPGCARPAFGCDLDHRTAFDPSRPAVDQTHPGNLHALCRFHHNLKTLHGWSPHHDPESGVTSWRSPLGTSHDREPEPPLPPWETWLEELAKVDKASPCPCARAPVTEQGSAGS